MEFIEQWNDARPYIEAHTSGSTGIPKTIRLLKSDMRRSARATNAFFGIDASSVLVSPLSTDYIAGKMMVVRALEAGCHLVQIPVCNTIEWPADVERARLVPIVPSQISALLAATELASHIDAVLIGGAAPSAEQCRALEEAGYDAYISYGMTETCSHVALARASDPRRVFRAMPGINFETDAEGRLAICAPAFSFGRLQTNDVVELIDSTSFCWRGRADGAINSGGIKLFPEELEALYSSALAGRAYFVRKQPHPVWGEAVELVVEGCGDESEVLAALRATIADSRRLPKSIRFVPEIPRTSNGKIRRSL